MKPKIIIAGGTGFLGQYLARYFAEKGFQIIVLSRKGHENQENIRYLKWDGKSQGSWSKALEGATMIINLAGKSVNCRYTPKNRRIILSSRIDATKAIGEAIQNCSKAPQLWINAASSTIYDHTVKGPANDEYEGKIGDDFSMNVCKAWEETFLNCTTLQTRKIYLRIGIVLGKEGGALPPNLNLVKLGLGGKQGNGQQFISWLHIEDLARIISFLQDEQKLDGGFNCVSPHPVRNAEFMKLLRQKWKALIGLPSPAWLLKIGAALIGTETELILKSRKVAPRRLLEAGFEFRYSDLSGALDALKNEGAVVFDPVSQ